MFCTPRRTAVIAKPPSLPIPSAFKIVRRPTNRSRRTYRHKSMHHIDLRIHELFSMLLPSDPLPTTTHGRSLGRMPQLAKSTQFREMQKLGAKLSKGGKSRQSRLSLSFLPKIENLR